MKKRRKTMLVLVNWMANGVVFKRYPVKPESWIKALLSKSNTSALWIGSWSELWTKKTISSHSKKQVSANNNNKNNDNNLDSPNEAKRWMKSCNSKKFWTIDWLIDWLCWLLDITLIKNLFFTFTLNFWVSLVVQLSQISKL